jgi:hypothetical protein
MSKSTQAAQRSQVRIEALSWRHDEEEAELEHVESLVARFSVLLPEHLRDLEARRSQSAAALRACNATPWNAAGLELVKECARARDLSARLEQLRAGTVAANDQGGHGPVTAEHIDELLAGFAAVCNSGMVLL